jgi:hypothetical protein
VLEGVNAKLSHHKDKVFADVACCTADRMFAVTQDGILLSIAKGYAVDKFVQLKQAYGTSVSGSQCGQYVAAACSDGVVRIFQQASLQHVVSLPKPKPLYVPSAEAASQGHKTVYSDAIAVKFASLSTVLVVYSDRR